MERAIGMLSRKQIVVLLGFQSYPTPTETNQISRIPFLIQRLSRIYPHVTIGFADHAPPESLLRYALAATALGAGARVLEKHLTLAQSMRLEDHESALNPDDFLSFAHVIRSCAEAFGATLDTDDFGMTEHEQNYRKAIRRHVVSNGQLQSGAPISPDDLVLKRTSAQNALSDLSLVYKRRAKRNLPPNQPITFSDIE
jgi:N,N'-diacetyllegionaminate synthase